MKLGTYLKEAGSRVWLYKTPLSILRFHLFFILSIISSRLNVKAFISNVKTALAATNPVSTYQHV